MSHHNDLHRPFEEVFHVGPTLNSGANEENRYRYMSNLHHPVFSTLQQPFYSAFKSPGMVGEKMSMDMLGYPFTGAQWKELERQALIYKYIMASVPVPAHLLSPFIRHLSATDSASHLTSQNKDPEIGRCKRTDGKKWRCSKEVAPHQKYCDRHMNRGRPRSRKHVENNTTKKLKKTVETNVSSSLPNVLGSPNPPNESQFLVDTKNFEEQMSAASYKEPNRGFEWTMDTTEQQFQHLIGASNECSVYNTTPSIFHQYYEEPSLNISSYPNFINSNDILENGEFNFFPNPELLLFQNQPQAEDFFDAIPNSNNVNHHLKTLSPSSLTLSMSMGKDDEEMDDRLGLDSLMRWVPGGPLGEVLRPMSPATTISSPSGVLQRTMISMSDSSVCNSPNVGASTATQPEIVGTTEQHLF